MRAFSFLKNAKKASEQNINTYDKTVKPSITQVVVWPYIKKSNKCHVL